MSLFNDRTPIPTSLLPHYQNREKLLKPKSREIPTSTQDRPLASYKFKKVEYSLFKKECIATNFSIVQQRVFPKNKALALTLSTKGNALLFARRSLRRRLRQTRGTKEEHIRVKSSFSFVKG